MPRPRKTPKYRPTRADLERQLADLDKPLTPPRPWIKEIAKDPKLRAALIRNIERRLIHG